MEHVRRFGALALVLAASVTAFFTTGHFEGLPDAASSVAFAQSDQNAVPTFEFDPTWPVLPLPNQWVFGNIAGVHVTPDDHVWILQRPLSLGLGDDHAATGSAECCRPAPPVIELSPEGRILRAWGGTDPKKPKSRHAAPGYEWPREDQLFVDYKGNVWTGCEDGVTNPDGTYISCGTVTKFTPDGTLIFQKGRWGGSKGNADTDNFASPAGIFVDPEANEAYIADGRRNRRVIVIDADTGAFKRMWGAYGNPKPPDVNSEAYDPKAPPSKVFGNAVRCVELSRDGLVYVCDRLNNRVQVFKKDGTYVTEVIITPETRAFGSVFDIAFSKDPEQRFMYVGDGGNAKIWILRRKDLKVLGSFGHRGRYAGEFAVVHSLDTDSKGNLYVGESAGGNRVQKFAFKGLRNMP